MKKTIALPLVHPSGCVFSRRPYRANSSRQPGVSACQLYLQGSGPTPPLGNCSASHNPLYKLESLPPRMLPKGQGVWEEKSGGFKRRKERV